MKKRISLLIAITFLACCTQEVTDVELSSLSYKEQFNTKAGIKPGKMDVTDNDISNYLLFKQLISKSSYVDVRSIISYPSDEQPSLFIINYEDSWEIISSDKRTPHLLASGRGTLTLNEENTNFNYWMDVLSKNISRIKEQDILPDTSQIYVDFWSFISGDISSEEQLATRSIPNIIHRNYELIQVDTIVIELDSIPHLVSTKWGQEQPFNMYCPCKSYSDIFKVPAGCVAVAGAQMLYFLQERFSLQMQAPELASCTGRVLSNDEIIDYLQNNLPIPQTYTMNQWRFRVSAWNYMHNGDSTVIAALIANVGKNANIFYTDEASGGNIQNLHTNVCPSYGIESEFDDYDEEVVESLLECGTPSIIGGISHAFIVDRYKYGQVRYSLTYREIQEDSDERPNELRTVLYTEPALRWFGMNWGYAGLHDDDWLLTYGPWSCGPFTNHYSSSDMTMVTFGQY